MRRLSLAVSLSLVCSCSEGVTLAPPDLPSSFALVATAQEGQSALPGATRVVDLSESDADVAPASIGGDDVDLVVGAIEPLDLPQGLSPLQLEFVSRTAANARPLVALYAPHILEEPGPADSPSPLVPVGAAGGARDIRKERILEQLALADPCVEPAVPYDVITPMTSSEGITTLRTLSDGTTYAGLSVIGGVQLGRLGAGERIMEVIEVSTGTVTLIEPSVRFEILNLGVGETNSPDGLIPSELTGVIVDGFGRLGQVYTWDTDRMVDETPLDEPVRVARGLARATIDGVASLCLYGGTQGSTRDAAVWCRPEAGGEWTLDGRFGSKISISTVLNSPSGVFVIDAPGNVYRRIGPLNYSLIAEFVPNQGCATPCVSLFATAADEQRAFVAGDDARSLIVDVTSGEARASSPEGLAQKLFADERSTSPETALRFVSATIAPDGAIWVADVIPRLFRLKDGEVERVCLPKELQDTPISAIEAHPDGRLILGTTPALFAFGDWRR